MALGSNHKSNTINGTACHLPITINSFLTELPLWFKKYNLEVPLTGGRFQQLGQAVPPESPLVANWSNLAWNHPLVANIGNLGWKHL